MTSLSFSRTTLQTGSRPTSECFLSSELWKPQKQTSIGYARNGLRQNAGLFNIGEGNCSARNLWTTHPLSSGLPLFLIPELRAVSGNLRQPEVKCFAYK